MALLALRRLEQVDSNRRGGRSQMLGPLVKERLVRGPTPVCFFFPSPVLEPAKVFEERLVFLLYRSVALAVGQRRLKREETGSVRRSVLVCGSYHRGYWQWV